MMDPGDVARWIVLLFGLVQQAMFLSPDRTNWRWGKSDINILMRSIVYKGIALPLFWSLLDKRGNSDTAEWVALIQTFVTRFGKESIAGILADREFVGGQWFGCLKSKGFNFEDTHIVEPGAYWQAAGAVEHRILLGA